jgi:hypothetical protein
MPPIHPLSLVAQRLYPFAQQAKQKWDAMPQSEKDRYVAEARAKVQETVKTVGERVQTATQQKKPKP